VNLGSLPELAKRYNINTSAVSRQLPTLILFEDGKEVNRFPPYDEEKKRYMRVVKYSKVETFNEKVCLKIYRKTLPSILTLKSVILQPGSQTISIKINKPYKLTRKLNKIIIFPKMICIVDIHVVFVSIYIFLYLSMKGLSFSF